MLNKLCGDMIKERIYTWIPIDYKRSELYTWFFIDEWILIGKLNAKIYVKILYTQWRMGLENISIGPPPLSKKKWEQYGDYTAYAI